jgi:hypothetical protein
MKTTNPLDKLIAWGGGNPYRLSKRLTEIAGREVSRQLIHTWCKKGFVPASAAEFVEKYAEGSVSASEIREYAAKVRHH